MGGFAHEGWRALIIVDFDVVIIAPIAGFDVSHRQTGSRGGRGRDAATEDFANH